MFLGLAELLPINGVAEFDLISYNTGCTEVLRALYRLRWANQSAEDHEQHARNVAYRAVIESYWDGMC